MKVKRRVTLVLALLMTALALIAVFAGCETEEGGAGDTGINVSLWEGNSYVVAQSDTDALFTSVPSRGGYMFGGWFYDNGTWLRPVTSENIKNMPSGTTIYAKWTASENLALVTFYDYADNVVLYRAYVEKGSDLSDFDITPTYRPADERYEYVFKGWDKDLTSIVEDTDVHPVYDTPARVYNVTFIVGNVAAEVVTVPYGGSVTAPSESDIAAYLPYIEGKQVKFTGWSAADLDNVTSDVTVYALYSTKDLVFEVTFNYGNGLSTTQSVRYGQNAVPPATGLDKPDGAGVDYVFVGWDNNYCFVTEDRVINAVYDNHDDWYRVDFYNGDILYCRYYVPYGAEAPVPDDPVKDADANYDYTFDGWRDRSGERADLSSITSDTAVYAGYASRQRTYTVDFYVEGTLVKTDRVTYGSTATPPDAQSISEAITAEEGVIKTFKGWDRSLNDINSDTVVNASIERKAETRKVTFVWGIDGELSETFTVTYGTAARAPEIVDTTVDAEDGIYVFKGWSGDWSSVKKDMTVRASYKVYPKIFEVRFLDAYGALIGDVQMVEYGQAAVAPDAPSKASTAQYDYTFEGWDKAFDSVTSDLEIRPVFAQTTRSYEVAFFDENGDMIGEIQHIAYGSAAIAPQAPAKQSTARYDYAFDKWVGGDIDNIVGDTEFTPTYTETVRVYTVTFVYGNVDDEQSPDRKVETFSVPYGSSVPDADIPTAEEAARPEDKYATYQFIGWDDANWLNVTGDVTVTAQYLSYDKYFEVAFYAEDGSLLSAPQYVRFEKDSAILPDTANIVKQQTVSHTYAFDGWTYDDGTFVSHEDFAAIADGGIDRDYRLTAHFASTLRKYTVIFYDDDRTTVLSEQSVDYGTSAIEPQSPVKEQTVQWVYTFAGWDNDAWQVVGGDTVVYATYSRELRKYDVTFVYGNVDDPSSADYKTTTVKVEYGVTPTVPEDIDTTRPSTAKYDYAFNGWNGLLAVNGDMTVTADYVATIRNYTVTFYNMTTGALEGENTMPYGSWIERTMSAGGYVFDSWYLKDGDGYTALPTKDEIESAGGEGHVNGDMTLYGNLVMEGIVFDSSNNISGYTGSNSFVVIPTYANRQKVGAINSYMFLGRTKDEIEAVYLPLGVQVSGRAFRSIENSNWDITVPADDVANEIVVYCEAEDAGGVDAAWDQFDTNWDSGIDGDRKYFSVKGIETVGDYNFVLLSDNTAIIQRFVNGTKKYVELPVGNVTVSSGENAGEYRITELAGSAFRGMANVETVFIASEWEDLKVGRYVFSGLTATIYLAIAEPSLGSTIPGIGTDDIAKWNIGWASTASGDEGTITLEWNCDGLYTDSNEVTYLLRSNGEAIAISQEFTFFGGLTKLTIPETLTVNEKTYTVTEIGDQLFKDEFLLTEVSIPGTITRIGEQAFYGTNLGTLTLAEGLKEIGDLAFAMNSNLGYVYIPASCDTIGYFAFAGANGAELFMGRESAPTGSGLIGYKVGWNTTVDLTGIDLSSIGNLVGSLVGSGTTLPTYWNAVGKTEVVISGNNEGALGVPILAHVKLIFVVQNDGEARLIGVQKDGVYEELDNFTLPRTVNYDGTDYTVTAIDAGAFTGWDLTTIGIPSTVTTIEAGAFASVQTINTDTVAPSGGTLPEGWAFDATGVTVNYGQTL